MLTVKLTDATVQVGGDFQNALAFIKSFDGRRYDGATKVWTVPTTLKAFAARCSFPYDVAAASGDARHRSGEHVTRWGTRYRGDEWSAKREYAAMQPPAALIAEEQTKRDAAEQALIATLRGFGLDDNGIARLRGLYDRCMGNLSEAEALGKIRFSSPERRAAVEAAFDAYYDAWNNADEGVEDYMDYEHRRIHEKYGLL
ncbi:MAG TPA: hypothetical protein VFT66_15555 [Roseiflexaceae bacterium]|nr:hypothetical protein [Roseiflexaceae bacterium]